MRPFQQRLSLLFAVLAFLVCGTAPLAAPIMRDDPCAAEAMPETGGHDDGMHHDDQHSAGCVAACCTSIGAAGVILPVAPSTQRPIKMGRIVYGDVRVIGIGRVISPDLGPPRPSA